MRSPSKPYIVPRSSVLISKHVIPPYWARYCQSFSCLNTICGTTTMTKQPVHLAITRDIFVFVFVLVVGLAIVSPPRA